MKVAFTTNIDAYSKKDCFPSTFETVPRKGEMVQVKSTFISYYRNQKLPVRLEVTQVTWLENMVVCELWYNKTDKELADLAGARTL